MVVIPMILLFFIFSFCFLTTLINSGLLYGTFLSKKLAKQSSLTLFYVRFIVDILLAISNFLTNIFTLLKTPNLIENYSQCQTFIFYINFFNQCAMCARAVLVIIITLDRTLAVFFPIAHHNYIGRLPNVYLVLCLFFPLIINNIYLWGICQYQFNFPLACIEFGCMMGSCYGWYAYYFELIAHLFIAFTSLALAVKLFIWNNYKSGVKNKDIERANYLALLDAGIIIIFDIIPTFFAQKLSVNTDSQSVFPMCRVGGYALEAFLVRMALRRKNEIGAANSSSKQSGGKQSTAQVQ